MYLRFDFFFAFFLFVKKVWDYAQWDDTLFKHYVDTFVGLKVQATGWPNSCQTPEQQLAFLRDFWEHEGIQLDPDQIEPNSGLRHIAVFFFSFFIFSFLKKTLANSLWGKFAQRVGRTEVRYAQTPEQFHRVFSDPTVEVLDFDHVSERMDRVVVRKKKEFADPVSTNCLPVAIFVTSYARLHLYSYMEQVFAIDGELLYAGFTFFCYFYFYFLKIRIPSIMWPNERVHVFPKASG